MTLDQLDPAVVRASKHGSAFTLACSRAGCSQQVVVPRHTVLERMRGGQLRTFCSSTCRGLHLREKVTTYRDGVAGRVCRVCNTWTPLAKMNAMGRAQRCGRCYRSDPKNSFSARVGKAKFAGDLWTLSFEDFMTFWGQPCHYCGEALEGVHLDRVNPAGGYCAGNVVPCCWACNRGKGDASQEDFLERCRRVALGSSPCPPG